MAGRKGVRTGKQKQDQSQKQEQKQKQKQAQIQKTNDRRAAVEELSTPKETAALPGPLPRDAELGYDEEADGDEQMDEGEEAGSGEPDTEDIARPDESAEGEAEDRRRLTLGDLLGSRPPVVLLRLHLEGEEVTVRPCAVPASEEDKAALEMLRQLVARCFREGRRHFEDAAEWDQLLGLAPAPLARRLMLLLRLAIAASEKVALSGSEGEDGKAAFKPSDIVLERFANKFAALPDGTPFSIRLLLLDQRGRSSEGFFDELPDIIKLLALRRALQREGEKGVAVSDYDFCAEIQHALEELLGINVPMPDEDPVRRRLRDNPKRNGWGDWFPNQADRQRAYDRRKAAAADGRENSA